MNDVPPSPDDPNGHPTEPVPPEPPPAGPPPTDPATQVSPTEPVPIPPFEAPSAPPPPGYATPPPQQPYGAPPPQQPYGAPPPPGYATPPPQQPYGAPPPPGYGAPSPPQPSGAPSQPYGAPPPEGYGAPPQYGAPPPPGYGAPPPPQQSSKGCGKAVLIVGLLLAVLVAIAVGAFFFLRDRANEVLDGELGDAPRSAYEIQPTACGTDADGTPGFEMEFTNRSGTRREFRVTVGFLDGDRELTPDVTVATGSLRDGESVSLQAIGEPIEDQSFTCKVKRVQFFGR